MAFAIATYTLFCVAFAAAENQLHPLSDEFISLINSKQKSWEAGRNFQLETPLTYIKRLMGARKDLYLNQLPVKVYDADLIASLPETFDPREKWPSCPTLNEIRDQGYCGSCWVFGAVESMTDRVCIYSNSTKQFHFSADDLLSCCDECGYGCSGGYPSLAWMYWYDVGIVSGGAYNSSEGCRPYEIPPTGDAKTPNCTKECRKGYDKTYDQDKHKGNDVYGVLHEDNIKAELYTKGPVEATFDVYEDFMHYKSGVYEHTSGVFLGGHAIKMMGWGVESGKKYWLCANSWNPTWGDKGFFKILRGVDHCSIEESIITGEPNLDNI